CALPIFTIVFFTSGCCGFGLCFFYSLRLTRHRPLPLSSRRLTLCIYSFGWRCLLLYAIRLGSLSSSSSGFNPIRLYFLSGRPVLRCNRLLGWFYFFSFYWHCTHDSRNCLFIFR